MEFTKRRGRRLFALLLCISVVVGGFPASVFQTFAAESGKEYYYELEREALCEAVCTAVFEGTTVDKEPDFTGEYVEEYKELFDADGTLYELKDLEVKKDRIRDKVLDLRVFVRIEGDIPLDGYYEITGEESVIFLLTNRSKNTISAVIYVDDLETGTIDIVSAAAVSGYEGTDGRSVKKTAQESAEVENEADNDDPVNEINAEAEAESTEGEDKTASVSSNHVGLLSASIAEDSVFTEDTVLEEENDEQCEENEVAIASPSDAKEDPLEDNPGDTINGEIYDAVILDGRKAAVAFATTAEELGLGNFCRLADETIYTAEDGGIMVTVTAPTGTIPADAELSVTRFLNYSEEYAAAAHAIGRDPDDTHMAALDISFFNSDGDEIEPGDEVQVSIDISDILPADADAGTLKVTHLENSSFLSGLSGSVRSVVVADEDEGYIDEDNAVIEFSVDNFSTFTIEWNDGSGTGVTVHVYNINGTSIDEELDEESYLISDNGMITISEIVDHLKQNASYTNTYTFAYATVYYETTNNQGGFDPYTIGSEDNSVISISKSGTNYTVNYGTNNSITLNNPYVVTIHLYYSLPTVTLTATENADGSIGFTTEAEYFTEDISTAEYRWALSDDTYGSIMPGENGTAVFTWAQGATAGDQVSVTVTMTAGHEITSDTYTLTYGTESTTITVTLNGSAQANANVALVDENGNTVAAGKTGDDGTITLDVISGIYTAGVTYVTYNTMGGGSTTRYTTSGTVTVNDDGTITGNTTLDLTSSVSSGPGGSTNGSGSNTWSADNEYYYEHIDVKIAVAEGADEDAVFSDLDRIYVYDEYGNLIYYSLDLVENDDTTDYNVLFDVNGTEGHSLVISSRDTIILVFEVYEDGEYKTYTETITPGSTYPEGEYYSYSDVNAYQLYNSIYRTGISKAEWESALNNGTLQTLLGNNYNENGIDIGGYSFIQVADYLCDTRDTAGQAGLDFVIDVSTMDVLYEQYDLQIAKSLEGVPDSVMSFETFEFTLQELSGVSDGTGYTEVVWDTVNNALGDAASALTGEFTKEDDGTWTAIAGFEDFLEYEAEEGTTLFYYVLREKDAETATAKIQHYGIKISVEYSSATGVAIVTASYCELAETDEEGIYNRNSGWIGLTAYTGESENGENTYFSVPFVNTYSSTGYSLDIYKCDPLTGALEGVEFVMGRVGQNTQIVSVPVDGTDYYYVYLMFTEDTETGAYILDQSDEVDTREKATMLTTGDDGYIRLRELDTGTLYFLVETKTSDGYIILGDPIVFMVEDDGTIKIVVDNSSASMNEDKTVMTVFNEPGLKLPDTGSSGTLPFRALGTFLSGSALCLLFLTLRRKKEVS